MIPNPWLIVGVLIAWAASLWAVGSWQNDAGHVAERVGWQAKENKELVAANRKIQDLNDAARKREHESAAEITAIGEKHAKDREDLEAQRRRDVAAARDGALKLRVAGACKGTGGSAAAETQPAAGGGDDSTTGYLPPKITSDLYELADDADLVTNQLGACQAIVKSDRKESAQGDANVGESK